MSRRSAGRRTDGQDAIPEGTFCSGEVGCASRDRCNKFTNAEDELTKKCVRVSRRIFFLVCHERETRARGAQVPRPFLRPEWMYARRITRGFSVPEKRCEQSVKEGKDQTSLHSTWNVDLFV